MANELVTNEVAVAPVFRESFEPVFAGKMHNILGFPGRKFKLFKSGGG